MESTEEKAMQEIRNNTQALPNSLFLNLDKLYRKVQVICTDIKGPLITTELLSLIIHCEDETLLNGLLNDSQKANFVSNLLSVFLNTNLFIMWETAKFNGK